MTFNLSSQNFTATLIMRIRSFLAFVISICITFAFVPVKTFAFSERGNAQFTDVVNTGKANDCPTLDSSLVGSISLGNGDSLKGICMHPTEVYVKVPGTKRKAAEFVSTKIISPRNNTTVTEVYGDIDSGTFTEKGGIDFQLITVLTPGGLEVPFAFSANDLTADLPSSFEPGTEVSGSTLSVFSSFNFSINLNIEFISSANFSAFFSSSEILANFDMCFTVLRSIVIW